MILNSNYILGAKNILKNYGISWGDRDTNKMTIKQNQYKNITQKDRELIRYWIVKSLVKLQDEIQLSMDDSEVKTYYLDFLGNHIEHEISMLSVVVKRYE